jgi:hypothetical protein
MALNTTPGDSAESLCTVAEADAYHTARGTMVRWSPLDTEHKEQLLRDAYTYLHGEFWSAWNSAVPFGTLPDGVTVARGAREACAVLALRRLDGPLDPELTPQAIEETIGPITTKYAAAPNNGRRTMPDIARMMGPYLPPIVRGSVPLVRA